MQVWLNYLDQALVYAILAVSLNLLLGYAGQVSVAHAAFAAIGGYGMGYLVEIKGWNFLPALLIGVVVAFIAGFIIALPALKLSVEYLILFTLAMGSVIIGGFVAFKELGGTYGLISISEGVSMSSSGRPIRGSAGATTASMSAPPWLAGACAPSHSPDCQR